MPKVSIIVLNWNQPEFTVNCVNSVLKQSYPDFEILLIDNASKDNSVEIFRKGFGKNKKIRIIENSKNLGYAGGNNEGVKHARGDYVAILNNDTLVEKDWLEELVKGIGSDEKIGAISAKEIREGVDESDVNPTKIYYTNSLLGYSAHHQLKKELKGTLGDAFGVNGCSFIYRKKLANPPFDPEYFIYAEDIYLGWLLNLKGYRNKTSAVAVVHHFHNVSKKSTPRFNKRAAYLGERNRVMNFFLFYELKTLIKILPLLAFNLLSLNILELRKVPYRAKSYLWLLTNFQKIREKRKYIQKQRKIPDKEIISRMSCKFYEKTRMKKSIYGGFLILINALFSLYCRLVGLKTIERT